MEQKMRKEITCKECVERSVCRKLCPAIEVLVRREEHHFRGEEILVPPTVIAAIFASRKAGSVADLISNDVRPAEVRVIPGLTARQLRVLTMNIAGRKSHRAIGRSLGLNQSTVGDYIMAARRKARRFLEEYLRAERRKGKPPEGASGKQAG
jgi:DNA-binding CsgD family transcriptional regulator